MNLFSQFRATGRIVLLAAGLLLALVTASQAAQPFSREGRWDFFMGGQVMTSGDIHYNNGDIVKVDTGGLGGFGFGYHVNDYLCLRGEFMFGGTTWNIPGRNSNLSLDAFLSTGRFNVDWNILRERFTPYLTAGIGYQFNSVELSYLPPVLECYYDFWGYEYCTYDYPNYDETDFTWNVGGGIRYDVNNRIFLRAEAVYSGLSYSSSTSPTAQFIGTFGFGFSY
jgi:opacity protein-like surface antigen